MTYQALQPSDKLLLGPGPASVEPAILRAASLNVLGYLDPEFVTIMDETMELLRAVFRTSNELTLVVPGTGMAGMEAAVYNTVEPGDKVVVAVNGFFGERIATIAERAGGEVTVVRYPWGQAVDPSDLVKVVREVRPAILACVHAETSTGVLQPMAEITRMAREYDCLLLVDAVTSLGGCPLEIDKWGIDACYSGSQKCVGALPGLAPLTLGPRARAKLAARRTPVASWYLDLTLIEKYWTGNPRAYHHTAPVNLIYPIREALRMALDEGLENRWARHLLNARALRAGLRGLGLGLYSEDDVMLPPLTPVLIPDGVEDAKVRTAMLNEFGIEIGGGLGDAKGKIWRIGLMGYGSQRRHVLLVLTALEQLLLRFGHRAEAGAGVAAAGAMYDAAAKAGS
ncbi:MAG: aminotransferase class V-fold PLP-dependent enzyme [Bacillota bacterium]|nr:aminotransferase class V-fold PLP-dependent enzyme [Bacillota bacterium]